MIKTYRCLSQENDQQWRIKFVLSVTFEDFAIISKQNSQQYTQDITVHCGSNLFSNEKLKEQTSFQYPSSKCMISKTTKYW